jgi:hypothetical protein
MSATVLRRTDLPFLFKNGDALCLSAGATLAAATVAPYAMSADFAMRKDTTSGALQPRSAATTGGDADMPSRRPSETGGISMRSGTPRAMAQQRRFGLSGH